MKTDLISQIDDAFGFAQAQVRALVERDPDFYPLYTDGGRWRHSKPAWTRWCDGFLPGMMWIFYEETGDPSWKELAVRAIRKRSSHEKTIARFTISASSSITAPIGAGTKPRSESVSEGCCHSRGTNAGSSLQRTAPDVCDRFMAKIRTSSTS